MLDGIRIVISKAGPRTSYNPGLIYKFMVDICVNVSSCQGVKTTHISSNATSKLSKVYVFNKRMITIQQISL